MTDSRQPRSSRDLKQRGMLKDTIVVWGGEFGRTPMSQTTAPGTKIRPGATITRCVHDAAGRRRNQARLVIGKTDELGMKVVEDKVHVHDLHATILHCLGLNH